MIISSEVIFLRKINYNDKSDILHLYSCEQGFISIFFRKKSKQDTTQALFYPLNIFHINIDFSTKRDIQYLKQAYSENLLISIREEFHKYTIAQFIADFLLQIQYYSLSDKKYFDNLKNWIIYLNKASLKQITSFHIFVLIKTLFFLGIAPDYSTYHTECNFFEKHNGRFSQSDESNEIEKTIAQLWYTFLTNTIDNLSPLPINRNIKSLFIKDIFDYYSIHTGITPDNTTLEIIRSMYEEILS